MAVTVHLYIQPCSQCLCDGVVVFYALMSILHMLALSACCCSTNGSLQAKNTKMMSRQFDVMRIMLHGKTVVVYALNSAV